MAAILSQVDELTVTIAYYHNNKLGKWQQGIEEALLIG